MDQIDRIALLDKVEKPHLPTALFEPEFMKTMVNTRKIPAQGH
jgi:hypothetical protein